MILPRAFYERDPRAVARDLLGKRLVRMVEGEKCEGILVETEAYYGMGDPASRAFHGKKVYNEPMWGDPGLVFVYNVHKYWMLNVVAHEPGEVGAVLFRALEPLRGVELMRGNRPVDDPRELTNGPGKLTRVLCVDKSLNGIPVTCEDSAIVIVDDGHPVEIGTSKRIGVARDLEEELRFFVRGNRYVSR